MRERTSTAVKWVTRGAGVLLLVGIGYEFLTIPRDRVAIFVALETEKSGAFIDGVVAFMKRQGVTGTIEYLTDDQGKTLTVYEASGGNARVWMQNVVLSGEDSTPGCERRFEAFPDSRQFEISIRSRFVLLPAGISMELAKRTERHLEQNGLLFQHAPWPCGAAAFGPTSIANRKSVNLRRLHAQVRVSVRGYEARRWATSP